MDEGDNVVAIVAPLNIVLVVNEALLRETTCVLSAAARRMFNIMLALLT